MMDGRKDKLKCEQELGKTYDRDQLLRLPLAWDWSERYPTGVRLLCDFAVVAASMPLPVGNIVLNFASGSCWASELLHKLGYVTVSVDCSLDLLLVGRERFSCDSRMDTSTFPAYIVGCDGHDLPFRDNCFNGIICMHSLHHMEDYRRVLQEMHRVLKEGSRAVFSEPGALHSHSPKAQREMKLFGVNEKDVVLSEIYQIALEVGFEDLLVKPYFDPVTIDMRYFDWQRLSQRMPLAVDRYVERITDYVNDIHPIFVLEKGPRRIADSRLPSTLDARIDLQRTCPENVRTNEELQLNICVKNMGNTIWLADEQEFGGRVRAGIKLLTEEGRLISDLYARYNLPFDVHPGDVVELDLLLSAPEEEGRYHLQIDMVDEGITWFEDQGSKTVVLQLNVRNNS